MTNPDPIYLISDCTICGYRGPTKQNTKNHIRDEHKTKHPKRFLKVVGKKLFSSR